MARTRRLTWMVSHRLLPALALVLIVPLAAVVPPSVAGPGHGEPTLLVIGLHTGHDPSDLALDGYAEPVQWIPALGALVVRAQNPASLLASIRDDPRIRYAELDGRVWALAGQLGANSTDPLEGDQYALPLIGMGTAWNITAGDQTTIVCVVDTGARLSHEDLPNATYLGGVDIVESDADPNDEHGHGTHVLGTIVATRGNGVGIAGLADVGYRVARVLNAGGTGTWSGVAAGIAWCADQGDARTVINLSLGSSESSQVVKDALAFAESQGALIVAAAGNAGCGGCVLFPANQPQAIAVGCTTATDALCGFSNRGSQVELTAPGHVIIAPWADTDADYAFSSGTSMSSPHVAGVAALLWSAEPELTRDAVRFRLAASSVDLGAAGRDPVYGYGRLGAGCALTCVPPSALAPTNLTLASGSDPNTLTLSWEHPADHLAAFRSAYAIYAHLGEETRRVHITGGNNNTSVVPHEPASADSYSIRAQNPAGLSASSHRACAPVTWTPDGLLDDAGACAIQ